MSLYANALVLMVSSFGEVMRDHPTITLVWMWLVAMLSYHQDVKHPRYGFGILSQMIAITCLVAILVSGFTHAGWWNSLIAAVLLWLHIQFTRRWRARPNTWW